MLRMADAATRVAETSPQSVNVYYNQEVRVKSRYILTQSQPCLRQDHTAERQQGLKNIQVFCNNVQIASWS